MAFWTALVKPFASLGEQWLANRGKKAERKDKLNEAKLNRDIKVLEHEATSQSLDHAPKTALM